MTTTEKEKKEIKATGSFIVMNDKGLHSRPSTELARCALTFKSQVMLYYKQLTVNAKSLFGILVLAAARGAHVHIEAIGEDAEEAVKSLQQLALKKFNIHY